MVHSSFHFHYARLIELLHGLEKIAILLDDPEILSKHVRARAEVNALEGIGMIEAPRGVLIHHYKVDEQGAIRWVNLIVATGHNNLAINRSVKQVAQHFIELRPVQGRDAQSRVGGGARVRPVFELLDSRQWDAGGAGDAARSGWQGVVDGGIGARRSAGCRA
ncbi:MAG TPA: hypothetical protein VGF49_07865 [Candidatus Solibacter sp.]|jgi:hypothetical protein